jgi:hypothetical protein
MKYQTLSLIVAVSASLLFFNCLNKAAGESVSREAQRSAAAFPSSTQAPAADEESRDTKVPLSLNKVDRQEESPRTSAAPAATTGPSGQTGSERGIDKVFVPVTTVAKERYLAYSMNLTYKCENFLAARKQIITSIPKFGFILSCETTINDCSSSLSAVFKVRYDSLYSFINTLQTLGCLQRESISGTDHTGEVFMNSLQIKRQKERVARKSDIVSTTNVRSRAFDNSEEDLTSQEETLDQKEFEKWQFNDRISWVEVTLELVGPQKVYQEKETILVPSYKHVLYATVSGLLQVSVVLLYLLPWILLLGGVAVAIIATVRKLRKSIRKNQ